MYLSETHEKKWLSLNILIYQKSRILIDVPSPLLSWKPRKAAKEDAAFLSELHQLTQLVQLFLTGIDPN